MKLNLKDSDEEEYALNNRKRRMERRKTRGSVIKKEKGRKNTHRKIGELGWAEERQGEV